MTGRDRLRLGLRAAAAAAALLVGPAARAAGQAEKPLPDAKTLIDEVRQTLESDGLLQSNYTFVERHHESRLDSEGRAKKTKTELYEVYPSAKPGKMYRRLVERDGKPLPPKELTAQDREEEARAERKRLRLENETPGERQQRLEREERDRMKEKAVVDELLRMDDIRILGREPIDGRSAILLAFRPRPDYRPQTEGGKVLKKIAGRAWIDEEDRQLVRLEGELLDSLPVGPGRIIRLQKGAEAYFERRKVNGEVWLPAQGRFTGVAKLLFFVLGRVDIRSDYSDYKRFSVSTDTKVTASDGPN